MEEEHEFKAGLSKDCLTNSEQTEATNLGEARPRRRPAAHTHSSVVQLVCRNLSLPDTLKVGNKEGIDKGTRR